MTWLLLEQRLAGEDIATQPFLLLKARAWTELAGTLSTVVTDRCLHGIPSMPPADHVDIH